MPKPSPTLPSEAPPAALHARAAMITRDFVSGDAAVFMPTTLDGEKRTVEVVWSTGARVTRHEVDWSTWSVRKFYEELDLRGARLTRLNEGAPLLIEHSTRDGWDGKALDGVIGTVERASVKDGEGTAIIRFGETERAAEIFGRVQRGELRSISVGYQVHKWDRSKQDEDGTQIRRAIDWEPYELSIVAIPADAGAQIRSMAEAAPLIRTSRAEPANQEAIMPTNDPAGTEPAPTTTRTAPVPAPEPAPAPAPAAEAAWRAADITKLHLRATAFGLTGDDAIKVMGECRSLEEATDKLQDMAAGKTTKRTAPHVQVTRDEGDTVRASVENAILHRVAPSAVKLEEGARQYRGMRLMELGRVFVEETQGVRLRGYAPRELAQVLLGLERAAGMQSTSDFKNILANVVNKRLRTAYEVAPQNWKKIARQSNASDFKEKAVVQLSSAPAFKKVKEGAEFSYASLTDGIEKYALATWGRIIAITRQTLINDDLGAFDRLPMMLGRQAAELEASQVWGILTLNANMSDGVALFHATHKNLAGSGAVISETTLAAARQAMREQTALAAKGETVEPMNIAGRYLVVSPKHEVRALKELTAVLATATSGVNVLAGSLEVIVDARLTGDTWFVIADPASIDTIEYAYLEGEEGLYTEERVGFEVDGIEIKARLDFAAKAIDWRGMYKNPGAAS